MTFGMVTGDDIRAWRNEILLDGPDAASCILGGWRECYAEAAQDAELFPSVAHMADHYSDLRYAPRVPVFGAWANLTKVVA